MTVLDKINDMLANRYSKKDIDEELCPKWDDSKSQTSGQSSVDARRIVVITQYNTASYQIEEILWDETPISITFALKERDPTTGAVIHSKVNLAEYMRKRYKIELTPQELRQPILKLSQRDQPVYLIPSRCHEASLPKNFTADANKMRDLRAEMITEPSHRYQRIGTLIESFTKAEFLSEW